MVSGHLVEKNGLYYMVLNLYDESGRRKPKWIATKLPVKGNKKRAEKMLMQSRQDYERIVPGEGSGNMQFSKYIEKIWLPSVKNDVEITTYAGYKQEVLKIVEYFEKTNLTVRSIKSKDIEDFYAYLLDDENGRGLSGCSVRKYHSRLNSALKYAVRKLECIPFNPVENVKQPKIQEYVASYYNAAEMESLMEAVKGHKLELAVILGFYGLRRNEVIGLKWEYVDFDTNTICISFTVTECTLDSKKVTVAKPRAKTNRSRRTLPMIPALRNKLLEMWEQQEKYRKLCGKSYNNEYSEFVYVDELGNRIKPAYITVAFPRLLVKNKLKRIRYHDLRHSCASLLIANKVSMKQIQEWLGHSTFATTANLYTHLEFDSKLSSADALRTGTVFGRIGDESSVGVQQQASSAS